MTTGYLLIVFILVGGQTLVVMGEDQCDITDIEVQVHNSNFSITYNLITKNSEADCDKSRIGVINVCNTSSSNSPQYAPLQATSGEIPIAHDGNYQLGIMGETVSSRCFYSLGQDISHSNISAMITTGSITLRLPPDERVKSWSAAVYKALKPGTFICNDDNDMRYEELVRLEESSSDRWKVSAQQALQTTDCLCFKVEIKGYGIQNLLYNERVPYEENCMGPLSDDEKSLSMPRWKIGLFVVAGVAAIMIAVIIAVTRRRWKMSRENRVTRESLEVV